VRFEEVIAASSSSMPSFVTTTAQPSCRSRFTRLADITLSGKAPFTTSGADER
jgi:hypothetical protein